jgi:hypothetical protein
MPNPLFIMPQPSENLGTSRKPMTRSEAARHAALVRWKKEQPFGQPNQQRIRNRIAQILAKKRKGKGKAAKPKLTDEQKQAEKDKTRALNMTRIGEATELGDHLANLDKFKQGKGIDEKAAAELEKRGLVERGLDGTPRLTGAGSALVNAAARGDIQAARDAMSRGKDAAGRASQREQQKIERASAKEEREKAKAAKVKERAAKEKTKQEKLKQAKEKAKAAKEKEETQEDAPDAKRVENRAKVAKEIASNEAGLSKRGATALTDFADGKPLDEHAADDFEQMGIVEKDSAGSYRLSYAGRAAVNAMNRGDARATLDAISRAADRVKAKADTEKRKADAEKKREAGEKKREADKAARDKATAERTAKEDASRTRIEAARIEAARNRKALDMELIPIDDLLAIKAGARHSRSDSDHLQTIHDSAVACGANCGSGEEDGEEDFDAEKAIKGIMDNPQWYASHECQDIAGAASALNTLTMLIQSELAEEDEDDAHITMLVDAARTLVKFISAELDELEGAASEAAATTRMGPMNKAVEDEVVHLSGSAVKALDEDSIGGYAVLFGDAANHDIERDYYTKATNFWLDDFGWPRPITYHHGMDAGTRDNPVIGHWTKAAVDDTGVWLTGQLDRAHAYYKAIKELAQRGYLKLSSDSAPQWVQREKQPNGANFVKRWPLVTASCTVTPMEPRMMPVEVKALFEEIGVEVDQSELEPEAKGDEDRARRITLELELLELELSANL